MDDMNENKFKQLKATLCGGNESNDHRYYVYGLFVEDKPYPFYIGKGQGARVFQHETEYQEIYDSIKDEPDFESRWAKLSAKLKQIGNAKAIEKVIIKWGLTSEEAYMCESALINLYQYMAETEEGRKLQLEDLTNAVNGHASDLEKANKAGMAKAEMTKAEMTKAEMTKARTIKDFLDNCALAEFDISTGAKEPQPNKALVIFIRINKLYEDLLSKGKHKDEESIKEITRGCWNISNEIYEYIKEYSRQTESGKTGMNPIYIAGIYQQVVKCVYKVDNIIGSEDYKEKPPEKGSYIQRDDPQHFLDLEWLEFQCCSEIAEKEVKEADVERFVHLVKEYKEHQFSFDEKCTMHCDKCDCSKEKCNLKQYYGGKKAEEHLTAWQNRKYFIVDKNEDEITTELLHRLIICKNDPSYLSSAQNPISRNFDIKVRSKNKEKHYDINQRDKTWFLTNHITKKLSGTKKPLKDISDFLDELLCNDLKCLSRCEKKDKNFTLKECLSEEESKKVATINNKYYKLNDILTVEEFDIQFDNKFHETAKKESKQSKKNKS